MHHLVRAFSSRTQRVKERNAQPPTPSSESSFEERSLVSMASLSEDDKPVKRLRLNSLIGGQSTCPSETKEEVWCGIGRCRIKIPHFVYSLRLPAYIQPQSKLYLFWLLLVTLAFIYNAAVIPLRGVFPYQTSSNLPYWLLVDYLCDTIYIVDIVFFKSRVCFVYDGSVQTNKKVMFMNYRKQSMFKMDIASLLPLDLLYIVYGFNPWLRLPRVLKIQTFWEFFNRIDQAAHSGPTLRVVHTLMYMIFLIHLETCGYYALSTYEGLNTNRWVYNGMGNAYIRCFYLATKTATSIGNNPKPTNVIEYSFMIIYWLSGVFVFALLIGQIRDIFEAATQVETSYTKTRDITISYMKSIDIPSDIQNRVRMWFDHNWRQQKTLDERSLYNVLPRKLQLDVAINVHYKTLSKVQLFQDCDKNLLYDLLLKLKAVLFLPGDYICRKGEVGKEMYIVSNGQVEVVGGHNNEIVFATLHAGSVFGEISLLALSGGNRRTADVRSKGFTNVFILSKKDFEDAMNDYPEAQRLLKKRAKKLLSENAAREREVKKDDDDDDNVEEIIKTPPGTPKLLKTVLKVMSVDSETVNRLGQSFKSNRLKPQDSNDIRYVDNIDNKEIDNDDDDDDDDDDSYGVPCDVQSQVSTDSNQRNESVNGSLSDISLGAEFGRADENESSVANDAATHLCNKPTFQFSVSKSLTDLNTENTESKKVGSENLNMELKKLSFVNRPSSVKLCESKKITFEFDNLRPKSSLKQTTYVFPTKNVTFNKNQTPNHSHVTKPELSHSRSLLSSRSEIASVETVAVNHTDHLPNHSQNGNKYKNKVTCLVDVHGEKNSNEPPLCKSDKIAMPEMSKALSWLFSLDNTKETLC